MATINLGRVKPVFQGAYSNTTAYVVDDIVTDSGNTYICIAATTGNAPTNATYWTKMAAGSDLGGLSGLTAGDIAVYDGSSWVRQAIGTAGEVLKVNSGATGFEFGSGAKVKQIKFLKDTTRRTPTNAGNYLNWGSFQKLEGSTTDLFMFGTVWAHEFYGNNVGNPAILWNGNYEYHGWARNFFSTGTYQQGYTFNVTFSGKASGTSDVTMYVPGDNHRWQAVMNPTNSDSGVSSRYSNGTASTCTIIEYEV